MVQVEQGCLRTLQEDMVATGQGILNEQHAIVHVGPETLTPSERLLGERVDVEIRRIGRPVEKRVLVGGGPF
jgi:hypothetical protein